MAISDSSTLILLAKCELIELFVSGLSLIIPETVYDETIRKGMEKGKYDAYMLQQVLLYGIHDLAQEMAVKLFSEGKITIGEAAKIADLSVGEMMELFTARGIRSRITLDDYKEGLLNALDMFNE